MMSFEVYSFTQFIHVHMYESNPWIFRLEYAWKVMKNRSMVRNPETLKVAGVR